MNDTKTHPRKISKFKIFVRVVLVVVLVIGLFNVFKPLPTNTNLTGGVFSVPDDSVTFLRDKTYLDSNGQIQSEQEIFDEVIKMIEGANHYILVDMFLYNDFLGTATTSYRSLSKELTEVLLKKKKENPDVVIQVVSDPINTLYGEYASLQFQTLRGAGVEVTLTDLTKLRDSNPIYSAFWLTFLQWVPEKADQGRLANILDANKTKVDIQAYLNILNFKANHRKVVLADYEREGRLGVSTLITSANPHDGSSRHTNTAIKVDDWLWLDVIKSEEAVVRFSGGDFTPLPPELSGNVVDLVGDTKVQLLTEQAIKAKILEKINELGVGHSLDISMFYISDRDIVETLKQADQRGVNIRLLFDPNKDAFGREKNGVPNRQVAYELMSSSKGNTQVRWCNTHGEQCHTKLLLAKTPMQVSLIQGSANYTRRNLDNYNLETNVLVEGEASTSAIAASQKFFDEQWGNEGGIEYSLPYEAFKDSNPFRKIHYRLFEFTGFSNW
ncbi:MAG: phospholipase [Candidatus Nomurabacteria bacterium]|nr:phospholipase [Candidatus Nomurabacteria bacterium]USN87636.1 MAG: phospholipase [Candidatus Nomurabacteria bacterium]